MMSWNKGKGKSKYSEAEKTAYRMGQVAVGVKNPNSKVHESFNNGVNSVHKDRKPKKSLF